MSPLCAKNRRASGRVLESSSRSEPRTSTPRSALALADQRSRGVVAELVRSSASYRKNRHHQRQRHLQLQPRRKRDHHRPLHLQDRRQAILSGQRLITALLITTSIDVPLTGNASAKPSRNSMLAIPASRAPAAALSSMAGVISTEITRPLSPT